MKRALVLLGHGSRDPLWRRPMDVVAAQLAQAQPALALRCAFLELAAPDLPTAVGELLSAGATHITIVPMFLGAGRHVREDVPALVDHFRHACPHVEFVLKPPVGEDPRLLALIAKIAGE